MSMGALSYTTKLDIASSIAIIACLAILLVAAEMAAPVLAGIGAAGAGVTGAVRLIYGPKRRK
jgi:hypothetical protein